MADNTENFVLSVELDAGKSNERLLEMVRTIDDLKKAQAELKEEYKQGKISQEQFAAETARVNQQLQIAKRQQNNLAAAVNAATTQNKEYADSLDGMREKLGDMQKAYATLSKEQRESKAGKEFLKDIQAQDEAVKSLEKSLGDTRRNVGNYTDAIKNAGVGMGGLVTQAKAFIATPLGAVVTTITAAVKLFTNVIKRSEEQTNRLKLAFAPLVGIVDVARQAFDKIGKALADDLVAVLNGAVAALSKVLHGIDRIAKLVGKDLHLGDQFDAAAKHVENLTAAQQAYEQKARAWIVTRAQYEKEAAEAQAELADKSEKSIEERLAALDKLAAVQLKIEQGELNLARQRLAMLEADAERAENDAAANEALAQARADVIRAETAYLQKQKEVNAQRTALSKEAAAAANKAEAAEKSAETQREKDAAEELKRAKSALDVRLQMALQALGVDMETSQDAYDLHEQYYADLLLLYDNDQTAYNNALVQKLKYEQAYAEKVKKEAEELTKKEREEAKKRTAAIGGAMQATLTGAGQIFGALEQLAETDTKNDEDLARRKKALALSSLAVDQAQSMSAAAVAAVNAIKGATAAGAATGPAAPITTPAFIAEMVGIVSSAVASAIAGIIQAKQIISGAYQSGGVIGGYTSNPSPVDNTYIHAATGEAVLTAAQQKTLFDIANGSAAGGNLDAMAAAMAAAVAALPAPVVVYKELQEFGERVATLDEVAAI